MKWEEFINSRPSEVNEPSIVVINSDTIIRCEGTEIILEPSGPLLYLKIPESEYVAIKERMDSMLIQSQDKHVDNVKVIKSGEWIECDCTYKDATLPLSYKSNTVLEYIVLSFKLIHKQVHQGKYFLLGG